MQKKQYRLFKNQDFASRKIKKGYAKSLNSESVYFDKNKNVIQRKLIIENLEEGYSRMPTDKFCDVTGYETQNKHSKTDLYFLNRFVFKYIKQLPPAIKEEFRSIRNLKRGY